jgi:hypothetical protein
MERIAARLHMRSGDAMKTRWWPDLLLAAAVWAAVLAEVA